MDAKSGTYANVTATISKQNNPFSISSIVSPPFSQTTSKMTKQK
jgi:hypothetical protein